MRKAFALALTIGLLAGMMSAPAEGAKKKKKKAPAVRVMEVRYENPAFGVGGVGGGCSGCPSIGTAANERYAIIQITDDVSPMGYIDLSYDQDGDGIQDLGAGPTVCGETPEPIEIEPATTYTAWPWLAGIGCPGGSSSAGTIKVMTSSSLEALQKAAEAGQ